MDTNALLYALDRRIDVIGQAEALDESSVLFVLMPCLAEVRAKFPRKFPAVTAMLAGVAVLDAEGKPDDAILKWASAEGAAVVTNDGRLKQRLKKAGVRIITISRERRLRFA
ncbi:hypothetical protein COT29_02655 [Candidatus Micrarchaeota archaeon CG08_land_8_20_14_0_20_59_11]|nr:MAG: hypothetical protein COT29_02655 [Candidatus Micrarchaeota archaeon CG08_land_8_20_14_0_20_59_11]